MRRFLLAASFSLLAMAAQARPVVVELYTSEACSSCPPAEALLGELQKSDPDILLLSFHVTYWDGPAWRDKYGLAAAAARQSSYAWLDHSDTVYTPEAVVDGGAQMIGSDRAKLTAAIAAAKAALLTDVPISVAGGAAVTVKIGGAAQQTANIWLFGFDSRHTTQIGGGENGGATITEVNVVRSVSPLGRWVGVSESFTIPRPEGEHVAVILQRDDGGILGVASD